MNTDDPVEAKRPHVCPTRDESVLLGKLGGFKSALLECSRRADSFGMTDLAERMVALVPECDAIKDEVKARMRDVRQRRAVVDGSFKP